MGVERGREREPATSDAELAAVIMQGEDMLQQLTEAHRTWGLETADRWGLDQTTGTITWTFPDKTATAQAQILASYNQAASSWLWAWANESVLPELSRDSRAIRDWGLANGHTSLAEPKVEATDDLANTLTAIASA